MDRHSVAMTRVDLVEQAPERDAIGCLVLGVPHNTVMRVVDA